MAKGYVPNWSEKDFVIKKVKKKTVMWIHAARDLNGEEIFRTFHIKELEKANQTELRKKK